MNREGRRVEDPNERHEYEFFQIIDKLERTPPEESEKKLAALGFSLADVNQFIESGKPTAELESILQNLAARGLRDFVKIDYQVIRGLAYYTGVGVRGVRRKGRVPRHRRRRPLRQSRQAHQRRQGGPARARLRHGRRGVAGTASKRADLLPKFDSTTDVFVLIEDETLRAQSLKLIQDLRAAGFAVEYPLTPAKPDKQFKRAQELKAAFTARVESDDYVRIRNLKSRDEIVAGFADAANHLG